MSKKDYELIAAALTRTKPTDPNDASVSFQRPVFEAMSKEWTWTVDSIAEALAYDNPKFSKVMFNKACGR